MTASRACMGPGAWAVLQSECRKGGRTCACLAAGKHVAPPARACLVAAGRSARGTAICPRPGPQARGAGWEGGRARPARARAWPIFTNAGPRLVSISRRCSAWRARAVPQSRAGARRACTRMQQRVPPTRAHAGAPAAPAGAPCRRPASAPRTSPRTPCLRRARAPSSVQRRGRGAGRSGAPGAGRPARRAERVGRRAPEASGGGAPISSARASTATGRRDQ